MESILQLKRKKYICNITANRFVGFSLPLSCFQFISPLLYLSYFHSCSLSSCVLFVISPSTFFPTDSVSAAPSEDQVDYTVPRRNGVFQHSTSLSLLLTSTATASTHTWDVINKLHKHSLRTPGLHLVLSDLARDKEVMESDCGGLLNFR